ncbi:PREDICTED: fibroblast growth factor 22 [Colobus angolensis palliatus]|uniref:Fibroblast growth factor n=1 Tax=Colobus angolensis palliatus TaxID=336983 RepID=A0A2K5HWZ8_COLAP|nr:PREDICTED: fibroblast growth factor 22 [Colobus angolensis palliatus]
MALGGLLVSVVVLRVLDEARWTTVVLGVSQCQRILEIRSVHVGVVVIKAVSSGFYVAMDRQGRLYGSRLYTVDCRFREHIEENGHNTYASQRWHRHGQPMFLALDRRGGPRPGGRTRRYHLSAHFLPILVS